MKNRHLLSALITAGFIALALGSSESPEQKQARDAKEAPLRAKVDAYYGALGKAYTATRALVAGPGKLPACSQDLVTKSMLAPGQSTTTVPLAYVADLERFAVPEKNKTSYANAASSPPPTPEDAWRWMTGSVKLLSRLNDYDLLSDFRMTAMQQLESQRFIAIVQPGDKSQMPRVVTGGDEPTYAAGLLSGELVVASQLDGGLVCHQPLEVKSSDAVSYRTGGRRLMRLANETPEDAVAKDFKKQLAEALDKGLPPALRVAVEF